MKTEKDKIEEMKKRLSEKHSVRRDDKFEKAFNLAWEFGHAYGLEDVEGYFDELVELIK